MLTLNSNKAIRAGSIVIWDSENEVLNTHTNLYDLYDDLLIKENELARATALVSQAITEIGKAVALNQDNTVKYNECQTKLNDISNKIANVNARVITDITACDTFLETQLIAKEALSDSAFVDINTYIEKINTLKVESYNLLSDVTESQLIIDDVDTSVNAFQTKITQLDVDIEDLNNALYSLNSKVASLGAKVKPTTQEVIILRARAYDADRKLKTVLSNVNITESTLNSLTDRMCSLEATAATLSTFSTSMRTKLTQAQQQISKYKDALTQILCDINVQFEKSVDLTTTSTNIAQYLSKTMQLINEGLLVAGENVDIEYINGFAKIHARIPEYEPRPIPKRDCFNSTPIELVYPAPPCPPLVPGCPSCPETTTTTGAPATTTAASTTTTTTTTTTTEAPGCYLAFCYYITPSSTKMTWYLGSADGSVSMKYPYAGQYAGKVKGLYSTLSAAQTALTNSSCLSNTGAIEYVVKIDPTKFGVTNGSTTTPLGGCNNLLSLQNSWVADTMIKKIDPSATCVHAKNAAGNANCTNVFY
jgi:predicted  nucleic acid-binding Zn-ribbon protein